jgi:hypothetical protein
MYWAYPPSLLRYIEMDGSITRDDESKADESVSTGS